MRLFCDAMLAGLARWLRAAGHDTLIAEAAATDGDLIATCRAEQRVLVSRDRRLVERAQTAILAVRLTGKSLDEDARQLATVLALDWIDAPFTRCLIDNSVLRPANESERINVPERSRNLPGPFTACPSCGRVFWPGGHAQRMLARLEGWTERRRN
ncbi:MAG: uncharacterized protein QOG66_2860 [Methylobacteriaceae bacterium]|jgi:uncharacterized protein with PIN domain|nr:uncharacterized protein [Methylobacteriaceae bacterium]